MWTILTHPFLFTYPQNPQNYLERLCSQCLWQESQEELYQALMGGNPKLHRIQENVEGFCIPALPNLRKWALSSSSFLGTSWKREIQILYSYSISRRQHFGVSVSAWRGRNLNLHLSTSWNDMQKCIFIRITAKLGLKKEWDFPCVLYSAREVGQKQMHAC